MVHPPPSGPAIYWSGYLEIAILALVAAVWANGRLRVTQAAAEAPGVCEAKSRTQLLMATFAASDSSWARLVRATLCEAPPIPDDVAEEEILDYRSAPVRKKPVSAPLEDLVRSERARIARARLSVLLASAISIFGSVQLFWTGMIFFGPMILAAVIVAIRVVVNARRAIVALEATQAALPTLDIGEPPRRPRRDGVDLPERVRVTDRGSLLRFACVGGCAIPLVACFMGVGAPVTSAAIGGLFLLHALAVPVFLMGISLGQHAEAWVDHARGEVVRVRSLAGFVTGRVLLPIETVVRFGAEKVAKDSDCLYVELQGETKLGISNGWQAPVWARTLNAALGARPERPKQSPARHTTGRALWFELVTPDVGRALTFYRALFGWQDESLDRGTGVPYTQLWSDGKPVGGVMKPSDPNGEAGWRVYFTARDFDRAVAQVKRSGGTVENAHDEPGVGRLAMCCDPRGATFALIAPLEEQPEPLAHKAGELYWPEINVDEPDVARTFYMKLFTWNATKNDGPEMMWRGGARAAASIVAKRGSFTNRWVSYVKVDDVEATLRRATELGAKVLAPATKREDDGTLAVLVDPTGAVFGVVQTK